MSQTPSDADLKTHIRDHYAERAVAASQAQPCGCSCNCGPAAVEPQESIARGLYAVDETSELPAEAVLASLGCGNPTALADLQPGRRRARPGQRRRHRRAAQRPPRRSRPARPTALDMTDEMLALARENQRKAGVDNVEFLKGEIEAIPLPDALVDVIISNCVVNLSTDKDSALAEAFRVLKPGGRLAISDIVFQGDMSLIPRELLDDADAWSACISGALEERDFLAHLSRAGFADASIEVTNVYDGSAENNMCGAPPLPAGVQLVSGFVRAVKPSGGCCSPGCCC